LGEQCYFFKQLEDRVMKNEAEAAVVSKLGSVESEQGSPKDVGSDPPENFGHTSAKSEGVSGSIPKDE
jgi:hypothetical protein